MARTPESQPTERELEILKILWERGTASLSDIVQDIRRERSVADSTVATVLKVMVGKGLVRRNENRQWEARITRQDTSSGMLTRLVDKLFEGSMSRLVAHIVRSGELSAEELAGLRDLLEE